MCRGDLVDYGVFPAETIALLREHSIPCVRGNHDRWAVGRSCSDAPRASTDAEPRDVNSGGLSASVLRFLADPPTGWNGAFDGTRGAVRHDTPGSDMSAFPQK